MPSSNQPITNVSSSSPTLAGTLKRLGIRRMDRPRGLEEVPPPAFLPFVQGAQELVTFLGGGVTRV